MGHVLFKKVDHSGHLWVDQDPVAFRFELGKKSVQDEEFPGVKNESFFIWKKDFYTVTSVDIQVDATVYIS